MRTIVFNCTQPARTHANAQDQLLRGIIPIEIHDQPPQIALQSVGVMKIALIPPSEISKEGEPIEKEVDLGMCPTVEYKLYRGKLGNFVWGLNAFHF